MPICLSASERDLATAANVDARIRTQEETFTSVLILYTECVSISEWLSNSIEQ